MKYIFLLIFMVGCTTSVREKFHSADTFRYQLQNYPKNFKPVKDSNTVYVIDYSKTGADDLQFFPDEIEKLKAKKNVVLSYFSIGEAEKYRYYFKKMDKSLIINENPNWPGNYVIKYWEPKWHETIVTGEKSYLRRIMKQGFDGVYLDIVDAFWQFKDKKKSAQRMQELIKSIRDVIGPDKILVVQNASSIIHYVENKQSYFDLVDGIGAESTFFYGPKDMNNELKIQPYVVKNLVEFKKNGKKVFAVEYIDKPSLLKQFQNENKKYQFVPLATDRALKGLFNQ